jgi:Zn-dependent protease
MDFSPEQIRWIIIGVFVLVVSVAFHEFGHAVMAHKLGDDTPSRQGRVTLNPIAHADPIGTLLLPLFGSMYVAAGGAVGGFGWGKPVQWQPHKIRRGIKMATANILVSFAGPFMNLVLATLVTLVHVILIWQGVLTLGGDADKVMMFAVGTNFILFFFNLLPLPPLDGGHIAQAFMPSKYRQAYDNFAKYGPFVILALIMIPPIRSVFLAPSRFCTELWYKGFGTLFGL